MYDPITGEKLVDPVAENHAEMGAGIGDGNQNTSAAKVATISTLDDEALKTVRPPNGKYFLTEDELIYLRKNVLA